MNRKELLQDKTREIKNSQTTLISTWYPNLRLFQPLRKITFI